METKWLLTCQALLSHQCVVAVDLTEPFQFAPARLGKVGRYLDEPPPGMGQAMAAAFKIDKICVSVNRDFFIGNSRLSNLTWLFSSL